MTRSYKIAVLNGDGIGTEVVASAVRILKEAAIRNSLNIEFTQLPIGWTAYRSFGRTLPPETLRGMEESDGWILGPLESGAYPKDDKDYPMASGKIRKKFDLFANIRPVKSLLPNSKNQVDLVIVRENTEGFYPDRNLFKGYGEFWPNEDTVLSLRVITRKACKRISDTAFRIARSRAGKKLVTAVHKSNVLIEGDGIFMEEARKTSKEFPDIKLNDGLVDSIGMNLVLSPQHFDVLVTTNLFGDVLSDIAAAEVGGLGLAPSLNSGESHAMAQAVHGAAPDIAGKGIANPTAEILSTSMLLEWMHSRYNDETLRKTAASIESCILGIVSKGDPKDLTVDIGGIASTEKFTSLVLQRLEH